MKKISRAVIGILITGYFIITAGSCANIIPPGGGPRDSIPPHLVNATPKDSTLGFTGKIITLTFDEYITVDNPQENLIVSPNPAAPPLVVGKLRVVTIKLKDSLEANTTYSLNFGKSIKDVNEGNSQPNFTYLFTTGKTLDDHNLSGKVVLAETGKIDTTLLVMLQNNLDDSAVAKQRPRYYTRLDGEGNFAFHNLPVGTFNMFALPNDYGKKYDDSTKLFAFLNSPVHVSDTATAAGYTLYAYQLIKEKPKKASSSSSDNNKSSSDKKNESKEDKRLKVGSTLEGNLQDLLEPLQLAFNRKIRSFDTSKMVLSDTSFVPVTKDLSFKWDSTFTRITVKYPWPENTPFFLVINKTAVADSNGVNLSKNDTLSFITKKEIDYGSISLRFNDVDLSKNPVLQLIRNEKIEKSVPLKQKEWSEKLFSPGEYEMRILYDENKNGIWDPGSYFGKKKQPEIVQSIYRKLNIKANYENDVEINIADRPPPPKKKKPAPRNQ